MIQFSFNETEPNALGLCDTGMIMIKSYLSEFFDKCGTWDMKAILEGALSDYSPVLRRRGNSTELFQRALLGQRK